MGALVSSFLHLLEFAADGQLKIASRHGRDAVAEIGDVIFVEHVFDRGMHFQPGHHTFLRCPVDGDAVHGITKALRPCIKISGALIDGSAFLTSYKLPVPAEGQVSVRQLVTQLNIGDQRRQVVHIGIWTINVVDRPVAGTVHPKKV